LRMEAHKYPANQARLALSVAYIHRIHSQVLCARNRTFGTSLR
jgi:hypothetical protein